MMLDRMKDLGFKYSSRAGITVGVSDVFVLPNKYEILAESQENVDKITNLFRRGLLTEEERYQNVIAQWAKAKDIIQDQLMDSLPATNPIYMMSDSGARGNASTYSASWYAWSDGISFRKNYGNACSFIIKEGLTVLEYFISSHGARKGLADTALKTADSGYLTRRLVDVAQDVIVRENDCGTSRGLRVSALKNGTDEIESLQERLEGRYSKETVVHPETGKVIVEDGQLITLDTAKEIEAAGIESVVIRSAFTCNSRHGVCEKCYGKT